MNAAYENPAVTVDMSVFSVAGEKGHDEKCPRGFPEGELRVLLIERGNPPYLGELALPGGFVDSSESIDDAAYRELKEETQVDHIYMEQLFTWGDVDRDPRKRVISVSYLALADAAALEIAAGDDARKAAWYGIRDQVINEEIIKTEDGYIKNLLVQIELTNGGKKITANLIKTKIVRRGIVRYECRIIDSDKDGIAFDHAKILLFSLERLRDKVLNTDIIFSVMPADFILPELRQVYETIMGRKLSAAEFKRKIKDKVMKANDTVDNRKGGSLRYQFNTDYKE